MTEHKFKVGSRVSLLSRSHTTRATEFKIVRLLPREGSQLQYRIKSHSELIERVAKEHELIPI